MVDEEGEGLLASSTSDPLDREPSTRGRVGGPSLLTNHARVLLLLAHEPELRLREIAHRVDITERAAHRIVHDLEEAGYLQVEKRGRRNHYALASRLSAGSPNVSAGRIPELLRRIASEEISRRWVPDGSGP